MLPSQTIYISHPFSTQGTILLIYIGFITHIDLHSLNHSWRNRNAYYILHPIHPSHTPSTPTYIHIYLIFPPFLPHTHPNREIHSMVIADGIIPRHFVYKSPACCGKRARTVFVVKVRDVEVGMVGMVFGRWIWYMVIGEQGTGMRC